MSDKLQQNPNPMQDHESCPHAGAERPVFSSLPPSAKESGAEGKANSDDIIDEVLRSTVHAEAADPAVSDSEDAASAVAVSEETDDIDTILAEVDAMRHTVGAEQGANVPQGDSPKQETGSEQATSGATVPEPPKAEAVASPKQKSGTKKKRKKKKRKRYTIAQGLRDLFPVRGDSAFDVVRKIIFLVALIAFAVCLYLITDYYVELYLNKRLHQGMQSEMSNYHNSQSSSAPIIETTPQGEVYEYLEHNYIADMYLGRNSDLVGYITIEGTPVSYPVVQRKSTDPNINTNDYYLYRAFDLSENRAGCIFMDYRCHFDEVVGNRRVVDNSTNLLVYGHNMKNESMFGSLKKYYNNYSYYSEHPIITLDSLYKTYYYKIFAIFIVDGDDLTSEYAFNCWNTFEFDDEEDFLAYVNNAKKRNMMKNEVDVTYGDQLLTLYTCNGKLENAKLIIMARLMREGEDPTDGTQFSEPNSNVLWPKAFYNYGNYSEFDPALFVPYD